MLQHKVPIQQDRLHLGHKAVVPVQMGPPRLHHADPRLGKVVHHLHQPVRRRHKIRIEDRNQLASRGLQPRVQRARLVSMAVGAVQIHDRLRHQSRKSALIALHNLLRHFHRLVGRVVEQLDLKPVPRILQPAHRIDQPVHHKLLVEDRQLHRNKRQLALRIPSTRLVPLRSILLIR